MSEMRDKSVVVAVDQSAVLKKIGRALFYNTNVSSFGYISYSHDGGFKYLSSEPEWLEYFYQQNYYHFLNDEYTPELFSEDYVLCDFLSDRKIIDAARSFNHYHPFAIHKSNGGIHEIFTFATCVDDENISNWYINNAPLLSRFGYYFKENAKLNINQVKPLKLKRLNKNILITSSDQSNKAKEIIIKNTSLTKWHLNDELCNEYLTRKEILCLLHLMKGKAAADIAAIQHRSRRTVEGHIKNIKRKLSCKTKSELINKVSQTNFLDVFADNI